MKRQTLLYRTLLIAGFWAACAAPFARPAGAGEMERRAWIERGKDFAKSKDYESAIKTWSRVLDEDPLNEEALGLINDAKFQSEYQVAVLDRVKKDERLKSPHAAELAKMADEMFRLLEKAKTQMDNKAHSAAEDAVNPSDIQHIDATRRVEIKRIFDEGLKAYDAGRIDEAFSAWDRIIPDLPQGAELKRKLEELKQLSLDAKTQPAAAATTTVVAEPPDELPRMLQEADGRLKRASEDAKMHAGASRQAQDTARREILRAVDEGRAYYKEGRYQEACDAWKKTLPYLQDPARIRTMIESLEAQYRQVPASQVLPPSDVTASPELLSVLDAARANAETLLDQSKEKQTNEQRRAEEAKVRADAAWKKGRELYDAGNVDAALTAWKAAAQNYSDPSEIIARIEAIQATRSRILEAAAQTAGPASDATAHGRAELLNALDEAKAKAETLLDQSREKQTSEQRRAEDAKVRADAAWKKGRELYAAGNVDAALTAWKAAAQNYSDPSEIIARIEAIQATRGQLQEAAARAAENSSAASLQEPVEFSSILKEAQMRFEHERRDAEAMATQSAEKHKAAASAADAEFRRGKVLYEAGRAEEAFATWSAVAPKYADGPALSASVDAAASGYHEAQQAESTSVQTIDAPAAPQEFLSALQQIRKDSEARIAITQSRLLAAQKAAESRRMTEETQIAQAKALYANGDTEGAAAIWTQIAAGHKDPEELKNEVETTRASVAEARRLSAEMAGYLERSEKSWQISPELSAWLKDIRAKSDAYVLEAGELMRSADEEAAERHKMNEAVFAQARKMIERKDYTAFCEKMKVLADSFHVDEAKIRVYVAKMEVKRADALSSLRAPSFADSADQREDIRDFLDAVQSDYVKTVRSVEASSASIQNNKKSSHDAVSSAVSKEGGDEVEGFLENVDQKLLDYKMQEVVPVKSAKK